jgi:hypothetical protein
MLPDRHADVNGQFLPVFGRPRLGVRGEGRQAGGGRPEARGEATFGNRCGAKPRLGTGLAESGFVNP